MTEFDSNFIFYSAFALMMTCSAFATAGTATHNAPFVSCASDGQQGLKAPLDEPQGISVPDIPTDSGLVFYQARGTPGVLGPSGWHCAGLEGSSGGTLVVTPERLDPSKLIFGKTLLKSPGIVINHSYGGTSGRFFVAETAARLFPKAVTFVQSLVKEGLVAQNDVPSGPYADDSLTYRGDFTVEYVTPSYQDGEGTRIFLGKNSDPITGVVIMEEGGDNDLITLSVRLLASQRQSASLIQANVENRSNFQ